MRRCDLARAIWLWLPFPCNGKGVGGLDFDLEAQLPKPISLIQALSIYLRHAPSAGGCQTVAAFSPYNHTIQSAATALKPHDVICTMAKQPGSGFSTDSSIC